MAPRARAKAKRAASAQADAALAERDDAAVARTVTWHGLELVLPPEIPLSLSFDLAEAENLNQTVLLRILNSMLGAEQYRAVRNQIAAEGITQEHGDDILIELFNTVLEPLGMSLGESPASDDS